MQSIFDQFVSTEFQWKYWNFKTNLVEGRKFFNTLKIRKIRTPEILLFRNYSKIRLMRFYHIVLRPKGADVEADLFCIPYTYRISSCRNASVDLFGQTGLGKQHRSRSDSCRAPNSEKVKMALSLELSGILWWNFAYILILTWCSPWDSQMTFGIGRGLPRFKFWKQWNLTLKPFGIFW